MHWFLDPVTKHYADFTGRVSRQQYWMFVLIYFLLSIGCSIVDELSGDWGIVSALFSLVLLIPSLAIGARRLHDTGRSGWWLLLSLVPIIGWIILLVFYIQKGDAGANAYGAPVASTEVPVAAGAASPAQAAPEPDGRTLREQAEDPAKTE